MKRYKPPIAIGLSSGAKRYLTTNLHLASGYSLAWQGSRPPALLRRAMQYMQDDLDLAKQDVTITIAKIINQ